MLPGAVAHFAKPPQFMLDEFLQLSHLENMVTGHGTPSKAQQQNQRQHSPLGGMLCLLEKVRHGYQVENRHDKVFF